MDISIKHDLDSFSRDLKSMEKQMPFVCALALTLTARDALGDLKTHLNDTIDRPRPFTINSMYVEGATKTRLTAEVKFKHAAGGRGAGKYLRSIAYGQPRPLKAFEKGLAAKKSLPAGRYAVPALGQKLDAYGNVPGGVLRAMLSDVGIARGDAQFSTKKSRKNRRKKGKAYFTPPPGSKMPAGVYVSGSGGKPPVMALAFVRKTPNYSQRLDMDAVALRTTNRVIGQRFAEAFDRANRTSRF